MENASKALIIAGAILIAILLISVGILVMNSMNAPLDQASQQATSQAVQIYNAKFKPYLGKEKSAREAINAITFAKSMNVALGASNNGQERTATATDENGTTTPLRFRYYDSVDQVKNDETYYIWCGYDSEGKIETIYVAHYY